MKCHSSRITYHLFIFALVLPLFWDRASARGTRRKITEKRKQQQRIYSVDKENQWRPSKRVNFQAQRDKHHMASGTPLNRLQQAQKLQQYRGGIVSEGVIWAGGYLESWDGLQKNLLGGDLTELGESLKEDGRALKATERASEQ